MNPPLSNAGRWMLDRRNFLRWGGTGLSGIALASLLKSHSAFAAEAPIRPVIDPANPYAPRAPHFPPKASRVLVIFAPARSRTWTLSTTNRVGESARLTDADKRGTLVTFQGENGNLIKPQWEFRPRGQSGKMTSDLLPCLGELADEMCFIHSMTAKSNTHGPAENQMATGFTLDGFPSMGAWATYALGSECQDLPSFVAIPDPRGVPQVGPRQWSSRFPAGVISGHCVQCRQADCQSRATRIITADTDTATRDFLRMLNDRISPCIQATATSPRELPATNSREDATRRRGSRRFVPRKRRNPGALRRR
jgi:hypothetical protein